MTDITYPLGNDVPCLSPVAAMIISIAKDIERSQDNKRQCLYVYGRSVNIYNQLYTSAKGGVDPNIESLSKAVDAVKEVVMQLTQSCRMRRFVQRQPIVGRLEAAHRLLDTMTALHPSRSLEASPFSVEVQAGAKRQDDADLVRVLETAEQNGEDILLTLGIQGSQTQAAIRALKNNVRDGIVNESEKLFAARSLRLLERSCVEKTDIQLHSWANSEESSADVEQPTRDSVANKDAVAQDLEGSLLGSVSQSLPQLDAIGAPEMSTNPSSSPQAIPPRAAPGGMRTNQIATLSVEELRAKGLTPQQIIAIQQYRQNQASRER